MRDFLDLAGRHILVTGAGGGIGRRTAMLLSEFGAKIICLDLNEAGLTETMGALEGEGNSAYTVDLSKIEELEDKIIQIVTEQGPLDGYVHSAGITMTLPLMNLKYEKLDILMKINFYSFFEIVRVMSRKGRFHPGMSIVGISSTSGECAVPAQASYSASKAAMNGAMRSMARELAPKGIRLNTVLPGPTRTDMYTTYLATKEDAKGEKNNPDNRGLNYLGMNDPIDVANAIAFLLSPASRQVTGVMFPVDAGYTSC